MALSRVLIAFIEFVRGIVFLINVTHTCFFATPLLYYCLPVEGFRVSGKNVSDFEAALPRASSKTGNTLELADGTFFLGKQDLGSKIFIRLLQGYAKIGVRNIVITGTHSRNRQIHVCYMSLCACCASEEKL